MYVLRVTPALNFCMFSNSSTTFLLVYKPRVNMVSVPIIPRGSFIQAPCAKERVLWVTGLPIVLIVVQLSVRNKKQKYVTQYSGKDRFCTVKWLQFWIQESNSTFKVSGPICQRLSLLYSGAYIHCGSSIYSSQTEDGLLRPKRDALRKTSCSR